MGAPVKRKREQKDVPSAGTSSQVVKQPAADVSWPWLLSGIQGTRGEPGAVEALNQLGRVIGSQRSASASKKPDSEPSFRAWTDFLAYWQGNPGLTDIAGAWERGDASANNNLTISSLHVYTNLLNVAVSPSAGLIALDSPYQATLATLIQELLPLLHYLAKYLNLPGKNDLATAALEVVGALLKLVRHGSARNATNRKIWEALNLDARAICRLLATKRKIPLVNKYGRKPDIRHLMFNVLSNLLSQSSRLSLKIDVLSQKGVITSIFKGLSEDPSEVVEAVLECMARLVALARLPLETRCRIAEDSWTEVLKLYTRAEEERSPQNDSNCQVYPPAVTAHRYLLFVTSSISTGSPSLTPPQRRALGGLIGLLELSDSLEQAEVAAHILQSAPDLLPSFWTKFAPSLEPRLSSKWVTSIAFATRVVSSALPGSLLMKVQQAKTQGLESPALPHMAALLDTALMPANLGKAWISRALQQSDSVPLVTYLACQFLMAGMQKCVAIISCMRKIASALQNRGNTSSASTWKGAASRLTVDAADRLPDLQVLIALVQKSLGRAFSRASSVASAMIAEGAPDMDGGSSEEDNTLMTSLALRTIYLYRKLAPAVFSKLRFDFGKLLSSPFFISASESSNSFAAVGQCALLKIISLPADSETGEGAVSWAWSKSSDGGLSPVASIIRIYLSSPVKALRGVAEEAISSLLGASLLFEHDASEIPAWLEALPREEPAQLDVLVFFDGCLQRCLQAPYKYVDQMTEIFSDNNPDCKNSACRQGSPILATVLEQTLYRLTKEESAKQYLLYMQRLLLTLACHGRCRCLLSSVTARLQAGLEGSLCQKESEESFAIHKALAAALLGSSETKALGNAVYEDMTKIEQLLVLAALCKTRELNDELSQGFKMTHKGARMQVVRLAGYLLMNGQDVGRCLLGLASTLTHDGGLASDVLTPILEIPEMPNFFEESARLGAPVLNVLCHLVNECGRLGCMEVAKLRPYADLLARKANAETIVRCAAIVPVFDTDQLLALFDRLLRMPNSTAEEECMLLCCTNISRRVHEEKVYQEVTRNSEKLYGRQQGACDDLLAVWAEATLPAGFISSTQGVLPPTATVTTLGSVPLVISLAKRVIQENVRSPGTARLLATAIYRSSAVWRAYSATFPTLSMDIDSTTACIAYLEIASSTPTKPATATLEAMLEPALNLFMHHTDNAIRARSRQILLLLVRAESGLASTMLAKLQSIFGQEALTNAYRLCEENLVLLSALHREVPSFETFSVIETFINTSLIWLVRRFAEDEHDEESTLALVRAIGDCIKEYRKKWLLKPHLVEPLVTAVLQNRLGNAQTLFLASALIAECKLQDHVYVSQMQMLLASRRLRAILQPDSDCRGALVELIQAFATRSTGLITQVNAPQHLLSFYEGTLSKADQGLLRIFRKAEVQGGTSMSHLIQNWTPWSLRGVCTGPFQVLANVDPEMLYRAQAHVLKPKRGQKSSQCNDTVADPVFYLALVSSLLDTEDITRSNWLALISSNALGLAICSLASVHKQYVIAGDRILARARNALQSAALREKDEILYLLDCVRNAIEASSTTSSPGLPPLIALSISDALRGLAAPAGFLYPAAWRWLTSRALVDTDEVPLFYAVFYSTTEDRSVEVGWLLKTLQTGVQTSEDWRLVRRRQVVELLVDYLQSGATGSDKVLDVELLKTLAHLTEIPEAVHDLISKTGFLGSLALQAYHGPEERELGIQLVENCITLAQPSKLRRARDGLWLADLVRCLTKISLADLPKGGLSQAVDILRRASAHLATANADAQEIVKPSIHGLLKQVVSSLRVETRSDLGAQLFRDLYDASMRLVADIDGGLFEVVTSLALQANDKGVREELINMWQQ